LLEELANECTHLGVSAVAVPTDVSKREDVEHLAQEVLDRFGRMDIWINNAGVGAIGPFERIPLEDHVQVIETDLLGTLYGTYFAYREFLKQGHGTVINIASELGRHTVPYYSSYAAAKHGIVGLDDSLRQELRKNDIDDVHVCTVMPTAHDTPFFDHAANYSGHEVQAAKPLHDPQDVIEALVKLAKDPKDKKIVGGDGVAKVIMKNVAPRVAEAVSGNMMHKTQMEDAPPAPDSGGAVHSPMRKGRSVKAGRKR
jgi:short-subunit dehydrogenase